MWVSSSCNANSFGGKNNSFPFEGWTKEAIL